ncbi:MAG: flavodoxin domain-containing protein [Burkholderiaceae bacterium]
MIYATVEGHTAKVARRVADVVESAGHHVIVSDLRQPGFAVPGRFDAAVLCAPIHMGSYPEPFVQFIRDFKAALNDIPTALVTVSLSITSQYEEEREQATAYPYLLCDETGWAPRMRHSAAGALKYLEYNYFKRLVMRRIAAHAAGPVDASKDYELTDWAALDEFTAQFLAEAARKRWAGPWRARPCRVDASQAVGCLTMVKQPTGTPVTGLADRAIGRILPPGVKQMPNSPPRLAAPVTASWENVDEVH